MKKTNLFLSLILLAVVSSQSLFTKVLAQNTAKCLSCVGVETDSITTNPICAGTIISVSYTVSNSNELDSTNVFIIELSDSAGTFTNPIVLDSVAGTTDSIVNVAIPSNTAWSATYRIRVISSNPPAQFISDNGDDLTINPRPWVQVTAWDSLICLGSTDTLTAVATGGAGAYSSYAWSNNNTSVIDTAYFTPATVGVKAWSVTVTDTNNCVSIPDTAWVTVDTLNLGVTVLADTLTSNQVANATYQWWNCDNDTAITGATSQQYIALAAGNYAVIVTVADCSDTSNCYNVTTTSISKVQLDVNVTVYPNPFSTETTILFGETQQNATVKIVDIYGKTVKSYNFSGTQLIVEKGNMAAGVYFIQMQTKQGSISRKIVVNQ